MILSKFASFQEYPQVLHYLFTQFSISFVPLFLAHRGVAQEVSLITKRGIEAKNYEGVSSFI